MKTSFVMYNSYKDQVDLLSREQRGDLLTAILNYANGLELPEMDGTTAMAFSFIKAQMDKDTEKYNDVIEKRAKAGRASGRVRAEKAERAKRTSVISVQQNEQTRTKRTDNVDVDVDVDVNEDVDVDVNEDVDVVQKNENSKKENVLTDIREKSAQEQAFDEFWEMYPKKKSKGQAKKAWDKLQPSKETIEAIMAKLPELIASDDWQKQGGQFIPYPATWLNAEGWKDEVGRPRDRYEEVDRWAQAISQY